MRAIASCNTKLCTKGQQTKERALNQLLELGIVYHYCNFLVNYGFLSLKLLFMVIKERGRGMMEKQLNVSDQRDMKHYLFGNHFAITFFLAC
jgi:hypothetical protein